MIENLLTAAPWLPVPLLAILGATIVAMVGILAGCRTSARRLELELQLKRDMLGRGMSAVDIERVIRASVNSAEEPAEPPLDNEAALIKRMLDDGHEVEDIERLVRAMRERPGSTSFIPAEREVL
jgi:hypothetical protein